MAEINTKHKQLQDKSADLKEFQSENKRLEHQLKKVKREAVGYQLLSQLKDAKLRDLTAQLASYQGNRRVATIWDFTREIRAALVSLEPGTIDIKFVTILKAEIDKFKEIAPLETGSELIQLNLLVDTFVNALKRYNADLKAERAQYLRMNKQAQKRGKLLDQIVGKLQMSPVQKASQAVVESVMEVLSKELFNIDGIKQVHNQSEMATDASPRDHKNSPRLQFKHEHEAEIGLGYQRVSIQDLNRIPQLSREQNSLLALKIASNKTVLNKIISCLALMHQNPPLLQTDVSQLNSPRSEQRGTSEHQRTSRDTAKVPPLKISKEQRIFLTTHSDARSQMSRNGANERVFTERAESQNAKEETRTKEEHVTVPYLLPRARHNMLRTTTEGNPVSRQKVELEESQTATRPKSDSKAREELNGDPKGGEAESAGIRLPRTSRQGPLPPQQPPFRTARTVLRHFNRSFDLSDSRPLGRSIGEEVYMMLDKDYFKKKPKR